MTRNSPLQRALFQAAKVGNIKLMREFITAGANPFALDEENHNALYYAEINNAKEAAILLKELGVREAENA